MVSDRTERAGTTSYTVQMWGCVCHGGSHEHPSFPRVRGAFITQIRTDNVLLSMLSAADHNAVTDRGVVVELIRGTDLAVAGAQVEFCWFPLSGLASVIAQDSDGNEAEVGIIGDDGVVNGSVAVNDQQTAMRILVQIGETALRVDARNVLGLANANPAFFKLILAYDRALALQAAFSALAYARYPIDRRLARWILMCADRVGDERIDLTHDALSIMLGVRRAGVTMAIRTLVEKGAIVTQRGGQSIHDRAVLLSIAGAGYGAAEAEYQRVVTTAFPRSHAGQTEGSVATPE